jgi:hypothetical protein
VKQGWKLRGSKTTPIREVARDKELRPVHGEFLFHHEYHKLSYFCFQARILLSDCMRDVIYLLFHLLTTLAALIKPGGARAVIAENLLLKQQLIIHGRSRWGWPKYISSDNDSLFQYNRCHSSRDGATPDESGRENIIALTDCRWKKHCRGLFQLPLVA